MKVRFLWRRRATRRRIGRRAGEKADPVERLRYVRNQMEFRWWPVRWVVAVFAFAVGAALLVWRIG